MSVNKSWMLLKNRACLEYREGVEQFLNFAYSQPCSSDNKIKCPCIKCNNGRRKIRDKVRQHLIMNGIVKSYTIWNCHGESSNFQMIGNMEIVGNKNINEDGNLGFGEVCGPPKSGKVIGYGRGVRHSMIFPSSKSQAASEALKKDNEELKEKVNLLISEVSEMKELLLALTRQQRNDEVQVEANGEKDSNGESLHEQEED